MYICDMRQSQTFFLTFLFSVLTQAQIPETNPHKYTTNWWFFGDSCLFQFTNPLNARMTSLTAFEGSTSLSNDSGELTLLSNGQTLDSPYKQIGQMNGYNSSSQSVIIQNIGKNFLSFTTNPNKGIFRYVSSDDTILDSRKVYSSTDEAQSCVYAQNNNSVFWTFYDGIQSYGTFILRDSNLMCCPIINNIGNRSSTFLIPSGDIRYFAKDNILASLTWSQNLIEIYNFDAENGILSRPILIPHTLPSRIEFSPNGQLIYVLDDGKHIYQYDISSKHVDSIVQSKTLIINSDEPILGQLQIALNDKIYFALFGKDSLGIINYPNKRGISSSSFINGKYLARGRSRYGLPNFNASYFYTPSIDFAYTEDCWGHTYQFEGRDTFDADGYKWIFEKGSYRDSILTKHCSYTFPDTGKWQVSHIAWNATRADTVTKTLTIRPKWENDVLGKDTLYCQGRQANITLKAPADMHCVHWNGEEPNLDENIGPIIDYDHFHTDTLQVDTAGTYIVKLTNKTFCQMYDTIVVAEKPRPSKSTISRLDNLLTSSISAAEYRWYYNGRPKFQNTNSNIQPDSNGYWQVQLVSDYGCESELSDSLLVGFASVDDVGFRTNDLRFLVYPNPSDGQVTIEVPENGMYHVTMLDLNGKRVRLSDSPQGELYRSKNKRIEINTNLTSGTYILSITDENGHTGSKKIEVFR